MKWPKQKISAFCQTGSGGTPSRRNADYYGGSISWVKSGELKNDVIIKTEEYITEKGLKESSAKLIPRNSILIAMYGATVGKTAILGVDAATNQAVCNIQPNPEIAHYRFVKYYLDHSINDLLQKRVGGAQPNVSQQIIKNIDIPLPPISEQQKIVEILDQADRLRKLRTDADKKAERILSALFIKIFGDPATNPMGWRTGTLGDVVIETQYGTSARANTDGKGLPVIRMNNIDKAGYLDVSDIKYIVFSENEKKKYLLNKGDILFNRTNSKELVGKTGIWSGQMDAVFASYLIRIRIDSGKIVPEFLWALMNLPFTKQMLLNKSRRAIGMANINAKELRNFPVYIPLKTLQEDFAEKMFKVIANKDERQKRGKKMEILFTHLLHCAFTGDLTTSWRQAHMEELLQEMEIQARVLAK